MQEKLKKEDKDMAERRRRISRRWVQRDVGRAEDADNAVEELEIGFDIFVKERIGKNNFFLDFHDLRVQC